MTSLQTITEIRDYIKNKGLENTTNEFLKNTITTIITFIDKNFLEKKSPIKKVEKFCTVCRDIINKDILFLPCFHSFHTHCIHRWIQEFDSKTKSPTCPTCRLSLSNFLRGFRTRHRTIPSRTRISSSSTRRRSHQNWRNILNRINTTRNDEKKTTQPSSETLDESDVNFMRNIIHPRPAINLPTLIQSSTTTSAPHPIPPPSIPLNLTLFANPDSKDELTPFEVNDFIHDDVLMKHWWYSHRDHKYNSINVNDSKINLDPRIWNKRGGISANFNNNYSIQKLYYAQDNCYQRASNFLIYRRFHPINRMPRVNSIHRIVFRWAEMDVKNLDSLNNDRMGYNANRMSYANLNYCKICEGRFNNKCKVVMFICMKRKTMYTLHNKCCNSSRRQFRDCENIPYYIQLRQRAFETRGLRNSLLNWYYILKQSINENQFSNVKGYVKFKKMSNNSGVVNDPYTHTLQVSSLNELHALGLTSSQRFRLLRRGN